MIVRNWTLGIVVIALTVMRLGDALAGVACNNRVEGLSNALIEHFRSNKPELLRRATVATSEYLAAFLHSQKWNDEEEQCAAVLSPLLNLAAIVLRNDVVTALRSDDAMQTVLALDALIDTNPAWTAMRGAMLVNLGNSVRMSVSNLQVSYKRFLEVLRERQPDRFVLPISVDHSGVADASSMVFRAVIVFKERLLFREFFLEAEALSFKDREYPILANGNNTNLGQGTIFSPNPGSAVGKVTSEVARREYKMKLEPSASNQYGISFDNLQRGISFSFSSGIEPSIAAKALSEILSNITKFLTYSAHNDVVQVPPPSAVATQTEIKVMPGNQDIPSIEDGAVPGFELKGLDVCYYKPQEKRKEGAAAFYNYTKVYSKPSASSDVIRSLEAYEGVEVLRVQRVEQAPVGDTDVWAEVRFVDPKSREKRNGWFAVAKYVRTQEGGSAPVLVIRLSKDGCNKLPVAVAKKKAGQ